MGAATPRAFWPDDPPTRTDRDRPPPRPFTMPIRHLPTADAIARARATFGRAADPLLAAWRDAFVAAAGDPEAMAARIRPAAAAIGADAVRALELASALDRRGAARIAARLERIAGEPTEGAIARDAAMHILEDATFLVALSRAGAHFALVADPVGLSREVIAGGPSVPPRLLDAEGNVEDGLAAIRAVVSLNGLLGEPVRYWESPAFRRRAGRRMAVAEGPTHLAATLAAMGRQGHAKAFLKRVAPKRGTWVADIAGLDGIAGADLAVHALLGPAYAELHESASAMGREMLVQEFLPFTREHRFLVVGHRVVASTASDRSLSVLHGDGRRLHPFVAELDAPAGRAGPYDRGAARTVPDRGLVAAMARSARALARDLAAEGLMPPDYCLDLGVTARGVMPIEINPLNHCGVYAADWGRVARALAKPLPPTAVRSRPRSPPRDLVAEGVEFLLDLLAEAPPQALDETVAILAGYRDRRREALARGVLARERASLADGAVAAPDPRLADEARAYLATGDGG